MPKLKTRSKSNEISDVVDEVIEEIKSPKSKKEVKDLKQVISTGSTLLDLIISGKKVRGGGIPGGIIVEIFGPSGAGKTALLVEIAGDAQRQGGESRFDDPEARLDKEYSRIYGLELEKENYNRPDTVKEMFKGLWEWNPKDNTKINVSCEDSLAALSTEMEMEEEDKMGMKRAKDFSEGLRKTARIIANNNWLIVCSNQEREGKNGITTPGGQAIPYYSSVRMRIAPEFMGAKIDKKKKIAGKEVKKIIGIRSKITIKKNSIDEPFRECNISIIFGYGIDDIRENLQYIKNHTEAKTYICPDGKGIMSLEGAIAHVEENNLEAQLKEQTIDLWYEIQEFMAVERKTKER